MQKGKLIEVKSVYMASAAKFGLLYGFMWGIIVGFLYLILYTIFGGDFLAISGKVWLDFITVIGSSVVVVFLLIVVGGALYNLVYPLGGHLHIGLSEFKEPEPGSKAITPEQKELEKVKTAQKKRQEVIEKKQDPWLYGFPSSGGTAIKDVSVAKPKPKKVPPPVIAKNKPKDNLKPRNVFTPDKKKKSVQMEKQKKNQQKPKKTKVVTSGGMSISKNF